MKTFSRFRSYATTAPTSETSQRVQEKREQLRSQRWWYVWVVRGVLVLLLISAIGMSSLMAFEHVFATRIYPHISIQGLAVGTMTQPEAVAALQDHYAEFLQRPVMLSYADRVWTPTLGDLGMQLDIEGAVQQALLSARHRERTETWRAVAAVGVYGLDIPLQVQIDEQALQHYLLTHLGEVEQAPHDAQLLLDGTRPVVIVAQPGTQVLIDATMQDIVGAVQSLVSQPVAVRTRALWPVLDDTAVATAEQSVRTLLQAPLVLTARDETWEWGVEDIARLIQIDRVPNPEGTGDKVVVRLNDGVIRQHMAWYAMQTRDGGVYPRVDWNGGSPVVYRAGRPGSQINVEQATALVLESLWTPNRVLTLPFEEVHVPTQADLPNLGLNGLISVGRTSFEDSEDYRVTNIVAGMRLLHGILLAPGDEFSFNETIGSIGPENGFVQGYAIVNDRTRLEWGGGICQDSTTLFRAAFWAGLPITERWNHSRYIRWYDDFGYGEYGDGPGIDSTIFLGGPDLRFVNDTGAWILIQTHADTKNEIAEVWFIGTRGGRTVEFDGPRISYRRGGFMDVAFTRIIKQDGVEVRRKTYWSTFEPW